MAHASMLLVEALRQTAQRLALPDTHYQWSSFASCNCGHLAQTVTSLAPSEIARRALARQGDWAEQALTFDVHALDHGYRPALDEGAYEPENVGACTVTGQSLDEVFAQLLALGMSREDIAHLERLSDPRVRRELATHKVDYPHFERENVVAYFEAWARILERELASEHLRPEWAIAAE